MRFAKIGIVSGVALLAVVIVAGIFAFRNGEAAVVIVNNAPFAAGSSAGNVQLGPDAGGNREIRRRHVLVRWVARRTGVLKTLYFQFKSDSDQPVNCPESSNGYGGGSTGVADVSTYPVNDNGTPRTRTRLRHYRLRPCSVANSGSVPIPMNMSVRAGQEFATVIRNADSDPSENYFSVNFLYNTEGVKGANGRNERSANARDVYYGLDPRELVGLSEDGGRRWELPVREGRRPAKYLPVYVQVYANGYRDGQPYLYPTCPCPGAISGTVTMVFPKVPVAWTIRQLGAFTLHPGGSGRVELLVDGTVVRTANLSGVGMLRAAIEPVNVKPGATVSVRTKAGSGGLYVQRIDADTSWKVGPVLVLGKTWRWHFPEALGGGAADRSAVTVYPLPFYNTNAER